MNLHHSSSETSGHLSMSSTLFRPLDMLSRNRVSFVLCAERSGGARVFDQHAVVRGFHQRAACFYRP